jgi:hypothetical protein
VRTAKLVLDEYFSLSAVPLTADTQLEDLLLPPLRAVQRNARGSALIQESTCSTLSRTAPKVQNSFFFQQPNTKTTFSQNS